jgi:DNA-binding LacI/PurR family transcriptional regulator
MVTMKTIAEKAGVSRATVSYVLNGRHHEEGLSIHSKTVEKIETIASQLGYRCNELARSVRTGKTKVFGFVGSLKYSYTMDVINGIAETCMASNYLLKFFPLDGDSTIEMIAKQCIEQRISGIICHSLTEQDLDFLHKEFKNFDIPIVLANSSFSHDWCSRVVSDDVLGAQRAVEHLLELGHRKIAHISNSFDSGFSFMRNKGYCKALENANIAKDDDLICIVPKTPAVEGEFITTVQALIKEQCPTALFCSSDPIAMKAIKVVSELGLNVPEDISVIGYAGLDYTQWTTPALTTVKQPFVEMGKKAAGVLVEEVIEKTANQNIKLPVELIIRESTAVVVNNK